MHLVIVEDLDIDREKLAGLIRQDRVNHKEPIDLSFYRSGEEFLAAYRKGGCDGIFLDILMSGISGIETAKKIREKEPRLPIIFTTTEPDFALDGFSVHAMDYLLKPLSAEKVSWCLNELREYLAAPAFLSVLETSGWGHNTPVDIPLDEILYGQYRNHIMDIHTLSQVFCTRLSFRDFTTLLPKDGRFLICGRGLAVNLSQLLQVEDGVLLLKNGERLPFSRRRKAEVQKAFAEWIFSRSRKGGWR